MQPIPIDLEITRLKQEIKQRQLQLRQVNSEMAAIRAHYQQNHMHGGGKIGGFVRLVQQGGKDGQLKKYQPVKERLEREKLELEQQVNRLNLLKAQGTTYINR